MNYKNLAWYDDTLNREIGNLSDPLSRLTINGRAYVVQNVVNKNDQVLGIHGATGSSRFLVTSPTTGVKGDAATSGNSFLGAGHGTVDPYQELAQMFVTLGHKHSSSSHATAAGEFDSLINRNQFIG